MRRSLSAREWVMLGLLAVIALVSAYFLFFYTPMTDRRDAALAEAEQYRSEIEVANLQLEEKHRMERELAALFARESDPPRMSDYDNLQPVMLELNTILAGTQDYSLSFGTVDTSEPIVRRNISLAFGTGSYQSAKQVLRQLHDSTYRCILDSVNVSLDRSDRGGASVTGNIVFFEYQK